MWKYKNVTRKEFERVKDRVEELLTECGAEKTDIVLPYERKTAGCSDDNAIEQISLRRPYKYGNLYYRIDEIRFPEKPFIVFECGSYDELIHCIMEDTDPFTYDLSDEELRLEIQVALGLRTYPGNY